MILKKINNHLIYKLVHIITYNFIFIFFIFKVNVFAEIITHDISLKFLELKNKPKLIFQTNINNEKKIFFPKRIIFDIYKYNKNPFFTYLGIPEKYKIIKNKYLILNTFYSSGGSGSIDNIYLIDLKKPRLWHLAFGETVAESSDYQLSKDNKYLVSYDTLFFNHIVILTFDKNNEPIIVGKFNKKALNLLLNKKFKNNIDIYNIKAFWIDNILKLNINCQINSNDSKINIDYNPEIKQFNNITFINDDKKVENDDYNSNENDEILSPDKKFTLLVKYISDESKIIQVIDSYKKNVLFSANVLNDKSYIWSSKNQFLFIDTIGKTHIINFKNKNIIEDNIIKNIPPINNNLKFNLFSNVISSNVSLLSNNNLFYINLDKLIAIKITNLRDNLKKDKYDNIDYSINSPIVSYPYIDINNKYLFYSLLLSDSLVKLMSVEL